MVRAKQHVYFYRVFRGSKHVTINSNYYNYRLYIKTFEYHIFSLRTVQKEIAKQQQQQNKEKRR